MGKTAAERQRAYRQRKLEQGTDVRVDLLLSASAAAALQRLARHHGVSKRAMLERLLGDAEQAVIEGLPDPAAYLGVTG